MQLPGVKKKKKMSVSQDNCFWCRKTIGVHFCA